MPSDPLLTAAVEAMAQPIAEFRNFVEATLARAEAFIRDQAASGSERALRASVELGRFAAGRIDPARFATLFPVEPPVGADGIAAFERAIATLRSVVALGENAFVIELPKRGTLGTAVAGRLADCGRVFGAAILIDMIRSGRYRPNDHDRLLEPFDFHGWTKTERRFAPPLIVSLDGADLHVGALNDFLDGREKIVLVVRGAAPPAALVRCLTPGTLVLQTTDRTGLDRVAAFDGPAVAAVMPEGAAVFLHDPEGGRESWQRLTVRSQGEIPKRALGGASIWQMTEDRRLLGDLARTPFAIPAETGPAVPATGAADAVDRLASWLLRQSDV
jgi:hypothetical protein